MSSIPDTEHVIEISSRHDLKSEIAELEEFVAAVTDAGLAMFIKSALYDSNSNCCELTLLMGLQRYEQVADEILAIALATISQFVWFDTVYHGRGVSDD